MTLGERIKKVRRSKDLTQQEFCSRIGFKQNSISLVETGKRNISDQAIKSICREFHVSEEWLRTGEGEMFVELPRNDALAAQIQAFLQGGTDSFRERLVSLLLRLKPEQWDALEGYLVELMVPSSEEVTSKTETTASPDIAAELAEVKRQNNELAAEVAAMKKEDSKAEAAAELSAWPSASAGSLSPVEKAKK